MVCSEKIGLRAGCAAVAACQSHRSHRHCDSCVKNRICFHVAVINCCCKNTQRPRAMQMNLFDLHCRGAAVFLTVRSKIRKKCFGFIRKSYIFALPTQRGNSSVGRASASQAEGRGFDSRFPLKQGRCIRRMWRLFFISGRCPRTIHFSGKELLYLCYYLQVL